MRRNRRRRRMIMRRRSRSRRRTKRLRLTKLLCKTIDDIASSYADDFQDAGASVEDGDHARESLDVCFPGARYQHLYSDGSCSAPFSENQSDVRHSKFPFLKIGLLITDPSTLCLTIGSVPRLLISFGSGAYTIQRRRLKGYSRTGCQQLEGRC